MRLIHVTAWWTAYYTRILRMPDLGRVLAKLDRQTQRSPEVERSRWHDWALANGLKVQRHDKPVLPVM